MNSRSVVLYLSGFAVTAAAAHAQVPVGFEIVQLTNDPGAVHSVPDINNAGTIVWAVAYPPDEARVYRYHDGQIEPVTTGESYDVLPVLNNNGLIAYYSGDDFSPPFDIVRTDGVVIPNEPIGERPTINDAGALVWTRIVSEDASVTTLALWEAGSIATLPGEELSNQSPRISNTGQIVYTEIDFSDVSRRIRLITGPSVSTLSEPGRRVSSPDVNDLGHVVWLDFDPSGEDRIRFWTDGQTETMLAADDLTLARINDSDDILTGIRNGAHWEPVLRHASGAMFFLPSAPPFSFGAGELNDEREAAWLEFDPGTGAMRIMALRRALQTGDMNGDCDLDLEDFSLFERCYGAGGPLLADCAAGDHDGNGTVDGTDAAAWLGDLTGPLGTQECP